MPRVDGTPVALLSWSVGTFIGGGAVYTLADIGSCRAQRPTEPWIPRMTPGRPRAIDRERADLKAVALDLSNPGTVLMGPGRIEEALRYFEETVELLEAKRVRAGAGPACGARPAR